MVERDAEERRVSHPAYNKARQAVRSASGPYHQSQQAREAIGSYQKAKVRRGDTMRLTGTGRPGYLMPYEDEFKRLDE